MVIKTTQRPKTLGQIRSDLIEEFPNLMFDPDFMRQHVGGGSGGSSSSGNGYSHNSSENKNSPLSFYSSSPSAGMLLIFVTLLSNVSFFLRLELGM